MPSNSTGPAVLITQLWRVWNYQELYLLSRTPVTISQRNTSAEKWFMRWWITWRGSDSSRPSISTCALSWAQSASLKQTHTNDHVRCWEQRGCAPAHASNHALASEITRICQEWCLCSCSLSLHRKRCFPHYPATHPIQMCVNTRHFWQMSFLRIGYSFSSTFS